MKTKLLLLFGLFLLTSCKNEPEPALTFSEEIVRLCNKITEVSIDRPLDINNDGIANTDLFKEIRKTKFNGNGLLVRTIKDEENYCIARFNLAFATDFDEINNNFYYSFLGAAYVIEPNNKTRNIDIIERIDYDERQEQYQELFVQFDSIVFDNGTFHLTVQQNYPVWNDTNKDFQWERVTVRYSYVYDPEFKEY